MSVAFLTISADNRFLSNEKDANYAIFAHEKDASADETVRLRDVATESALRALDGHPGPVNTVAFSPDGWLKENLLENENLFEEENLLEEPEPAPRNFQDMGRYRLVIAIDYGATYTGQQSSSSCADAG